MIYINKIKNILNINKFNIKVKKYINKNIYKLKSIKIFIINEVIYYTYKNLIKILNIKTIKKNNIILFKFDIFKNQKIKKPIYIILINNLNKKIKNTIYLNIKKKTKISFIEQHILIKKNNNFKYKYYINIKKLSYINYINLLMNKNFSIYKIYNFINLNKKSSLNIINFYLNIKNINIISNFYLYKKSNLNINIISIPNNKNKFIFNNKIIHKFKKSKSFYKHNCLINTKSKILINSLTKIKKKAKNSISYIINKNLFLNKKFKIINKPKIQIFNKYNKYKHKNTITNINKNTIFYLLNRGINLNNIKKIISISFIKNILKYVKQINFKKLIKNIIINKIIKWT